MLAILRRQLLLLFGALGRSGYSRELQSLFRCSQIYFLTGCTYHRVGSGRFDGREVVGAKIEEVSSHLCEDTYLNIVS